MEHILCKELMSQIKGLVDPLQFAYINDQSTVDASLILLHKVQHHLDKTNAPVRVLFMDFTSAFNTVHFKRKIARSRCKQLVDFMDFFFFKK